MADSAVSGPKGIAYQVVSAEELLRRETDTVRSRVDARRGAVRMLRASVGEAVAVTVPETRIRSFQRADLAELSAIESGLIAEEKALAAAAERAHAARARATLTAELEALRVDLPALRFRRPDEARTTAAPVRAQEADPSPRVARRLEAVLELAVLLDENLRMDLAELASVVTAAPGSVRAQAFLTEMEARVTAATNRQRDLENRRRRIRELQYTFAELLGSETAEGGEARTVLSTLTDESGQAAIDSSARRLRDLERGRIVAADRRFALEQATAVLREMGYAVDLEPGSSAGDLIAIASTGAWPHHGLRLVFPAGRAGIHTLPVAFDETDARDDVAFEESSCGDVERLRTGLLSRGVPTDLTHHVQPGELVVQRQVRTSTVRPAPSRIRKQKR